MAIRIYLDTSVYNRPFDDQSQPRIWLESLPFSIILQLIENHSIELATSTVISFENSLNPYELRRAWVEKVTKLAIVTKIVDEPVLQRGKHLEAAGIKALDALHVATAETSQVAYFITCDDRLIRRYRSLPQPLLTICDPTEFVRLVTSQN